MGTGGRETKTAMTKAERARQTIEKDKRVGVGGPSVIVRKVELPKRGAQQAAIVLSGRRTTLGELLSRALDRFDARRV